jgi:hypothetical protein
MFDFTTTNDLMVRSAPQERVSNHGRQRAHAAANTASILVFNVSALNGLTM